MNKEIRVGDKLVFVNPINDEPTYVFVIANISNYREPSLKYAIDVYDKHKNCITKEDVLFCSEETIMNHCIKIRGEDEIDGYFRN